MATLACRAARLTSLLHGSNSSRHNAFPSIRTIGKTSHLRDTAHARGRGMTTLNAKGKTEGMPSISLGYEMSPLHDITADNALLEKNLRHGIRSVLTHAPAPAPATVRPQGAGAGAGAAASSSSSSSSSLQSQYPPHIQTYELLSDLWATEEASLDVGHMHLAHVISLRGGAAAPTPASTALSEVARKTAIVADVHAAAKESRDIAKILRHRQLDHLCFNVGALSAAASLPLAVDAGAHITAVAEALRGMGMGAGAGSPALGLHFPTSLLSRPDLDLDVSGANAPSTGVGVSGKAGGIGYDAEPPLKKQVKAWVSSGLFSMISIACNSASHKGAKLVRQWLDEAEAETGRLQSKTGAARSPRPRLLVVASEALRVHATRPGLLATPANYTTQRKKATAPPSFTDQFRSAFSKLSAAAAPEASPFAASSSSSSSSSTPLPLQTALNASVEEFRVAMDRCLHVEKHYLKELAPRVAAAAAAVAAAAAAKTGVSDTAAAESDLNVPVTDVCWAHVLMQAHDTFRGPEEWEFALRTQIIPKLDKAFLKLKKVDAKCEEFTVVYGGIVRNLFGVFLHLHQTRRIALCNEVLEPFRFRSAQEQGHTAAHAHTSRSGANAGVESSDSLSARIAAAVGLSDNGEDKDKDKDKNKETIHSALARCAEAGQVAVALSCAAIRPDLVHVAGIELTVVEAWQRASSVATTVAEAEAGAAAEAHRIYEHAIRPVAERYN